MSKAHDLLRQLLSTSDLIAVVMPLMLTAGLLFGLAYWVMDPAPPHRVVMATGAAEGAYDEFGKRYQALLAPYGVKLELRNTHGAVENQQLLQDERSGVDVAFLQGGAEDPTTPSTEDRLESLGSLFHEPLWVFYRQDSARRLLHADTLGSLAQLAGWRVNIGAPGSGAANVFLKLLEANAIAPSALDVQRRKQAEAIAALHAGRSDAIVFTSAPESPIIQRLLKTPGVRLMDFPQAEAYSRRLPFLRPLTLPRGVVDLARDVPPADMHLLAPTATLAARPGMHPALAQLFVQAALQVHGDAGWFQRKGEFPNRVDGVRSLNPEAERFYRNGPPLLQRHLPFWFANLIDRMGVAMVSIIAILIPLSRVVPPLYAFRIRSRIFHWYEQLRVIERGAGRRPLPELVRELDRMEARVGGLAVPLTYAQQVYSLRSHIALVRRELGERATRLAPVTTLRALP